MKGIRLQICLVSLLSLVFGVLGAVPYTTLGHMKVPYAYSLPHKMAELSVSGLMTKKFETENNAVVSDEDDFAFSGVFNLGLWDYFTIGAVYSSHEIFYANVKAQVIHETDVLPAIAFGVDNLFSEVEEYRDEAGESLDKVEYSFADPDDYIRNSLYFVMSKSTILRGLPFANELGTVVHFGFGQRRFLGNIDLSKQFAGFFGAVEFQINQYLGLVTEFDGYNLNAGFDFRYHNFSMRAGVYRIEEIDRRDPKFAMNLMYTLDYFSDKKSADKTRQINPRQTVTPETEYIVRPGGETQMGSNPLQDQFDDIRARRESVERQLEEIKRILEESEEE